MNYRERSYVVEHSQNNMRLDMFLAHKITRLSRTQAQKCINNGAVSLEPAREAKASLRVQAGDVVRLIQKLNDEEPQFDELRLIDENDAFWCFDKPAGMLVHPTARAYRNCVTVYVEEVLGKTPYVVHRLDKESSGLLLVAKTAKVSAQLGKLFLSCEVLKDYKAVVYDPFCRHELGKKRSICDALGYAGTLLPKLCMGHGKLSAQSDVRALERNAALALVCLRPITGRQHQLRAHLALQRTPILGDKLYFFGEAFYKAYLDDEEVPDYLPYRHLLHASKLTFSWRGEAFSYTSELPDIFEKSMNLALDERHLPTKHAQYFAKNQTNDISHE
ncbi:MAG: RluA family pseudouridine synthase [Bradymonadales bacterium]